MTNQKTLVFSSTLTQSESTARIFWCASLAASPPQCRLVKVLSIPKGNAVELGVGRAEAYFAEARLVECSACHVELRYRSVRPTKKLISITLTPKGFYIPAQGSALGRVKI